MSDTPGAEIQPFMRPGHVVMALPRLGAMHPSRLSFARTLIRRMHRERWRIERSQWVMDDSGYGHAVYRVHLPNTSLSFVAFTAALDPGERTDRVIATQWDAAFVLIDAEVDSERLARLKVNVPRQEAGRVASGELVLSRANKSVRVFEHVVDALAAGRQPDANVINTVGYLMRTTAVYGNGKFGLADLERLHSSGVFQLPYQAEMLTVFLAREMSFDLVEHVARCRGAGRAVRLAPMLRRALGVGNATGLGMAPFLIRHPQLIHRWMWSRERALAVVKSIAIASPRAKQRLLSLLTRAIAHVGQWRVDDVRQQTRITLLERELAALQAKLNHSGQSLLSAPMPFARLCTALHESDSVETQELVNSLLLELYPQHVNGYELTTATAEGMQVDATMTLHRLVEIIESRYAWALQENFACARSQARFWYMSQEKAEPRLGDRNIDVGAEREMRIDIARQVQALHDELAQLTPFQRRHERVADFVLGRAQWRGVVARVQSLAALEYAEICGNVLSDQCMAVDMLRAKLATFGAGRFDPKSDRWTRITLFQGAPCADELSEPSADDWWMPLMPSAP